MWVSFDVGALYSALYDESTYKVPLSVVSVRIVSVRIVSVRIVSVRIVSVRIH